MTEKQNNLHLETIEGKYNFQLEAAEIFNRLVQIPELVLELNGLLQDFNSHNHDMHNDVRYQPLGDYAALVHGHSMSEIQETVDKKVMTATERDVLSTLGTNFAKSDFSNVITKSLSQNGYYKFPDGFLIQWGYFSGGTANNQSINFPLSFKSCFSLAFSSTTDNTNNSIWSVNYAAIYASYFTVYRRYADAGTIANSSQSFRWIAIGTWK